MTRVTAELGASTVTRSPLSSRRGTLFAVVAGASVVAASTAGRVISAAPVRGWYRTLAKPSFNPPDWAFPVAWSCLFLLMGIAFWRVLSKPDGAPGRKVAIALFSVQLAVNVGWTLAFFGAQSPALGMIVIVPFFVLIVATAVSFGRMDRPAGWMLAPYALWVAFAATLNFEIWRFN